MGVTDWSLFLEDELQEKEYQELRQKNFLTIVNHQSQCVPRSIRVSINELLI